MDHQETLALFDRRLRRDAVADSPTTLVERVGDVVRQTGQDADWSAVVWSDLDSGTADAAIAEQVRHFTAIGRDFEWKLYGHDRPGDLGARLRAAGFTPEPPETLMVAEIGELSTVPALPDGVRLADVTDPAGVELMVEANERAFGTSLPWMRDRLLGSLGRETVVLTVALAGELPVSAARMELYPDTCFAGLWGGGTVPDWRGRGIYRALVAHRARTAADRGYRFLQVDASDESRPILRRLGFAELSTTTPYAYSVRP
ncbi:GNAT family N-acetyltransferase [Streptomyces sp. NPDC020965]|uniref:GNAT family N-acetyltransferase n=1 Tax=Streptomyces sp. NPDC020965 TaxID=3365105 RepID=UPI00379CF8AE